MTEEHNTASFPEVADSPEMIAQALAGRVDRGLQELGLPPRDARRWGDCNFVPDAVSYCATQDGKEKGYEVRADIYQAQDLHLAAVGKQPKHEVVPQDGDWGDPAFIADRHAREDAYYADPVIAQVSRSTFPHGFNVVEINGTLFLFDLSFSQFIGADGMLTQIADQKSSGVSNDHPLAQQLVHEGFIPLTDENLQTYMRLLCTYQPDYLARVTTDLLKRVTPLQFAMDDNELAGRIPPTYHAPGA